MFSYLQSVIAAFFGVQSEQKRQFDFANLKVTNLIILAIVVLGVFILAVIALVQWAMSLAQ